MRDAPTLFDSFAATLEYPTKETRDAFVRCLEVLLDEREGEERFEQAVKRYEKFIAETVGFTSEDLEELYTRTFDINPVANLEIGWHLYGETYERGTFLVQMRDHLRRFGIAESTELPDHLTHVLKLFGRLEEEEAQAFATTYLLPSLDKMLGHLQGKNNPYEHLLACLREVVRRQSEPHPGVEL